MVALLSVEEVSDVEGVKCNGRAPVGGRSQ